MKPRTYMKKGVWHLGKARKKQNGRFLGLLAKPLLTSLAGVAGPPLLNFATKKYLVEVQGGEEEVLEHI